MEMLEQCILDLQDSNDDFYVLLTGDFNARTANENYSLSDDDFDSELTTVYVNSDFTRNSQDIHSNIFGNQLLELCNMFDYMILNGLCQREFDDGYTFISTSGASTVDYFILSCELYSSINIVAVDIKSMTESDHLSIAMTVDWKANVTDDNMTTDKGEQPMVKKVWFGKMKRKIIISIC